VNYYSAKPVKGVIDPKFIKEVAEQLDAAPKEIAA
jgi:hypothetical protein